MNPTELRRQIEIVKEHVDDLERRSRLESPSEALIEIMEDLRTSLEELRLAEEQWRESDNRLETAMQALEGERRRYQELFDFAPEGYLLTDAAGIIQQANRAASEMLQIQSDLLVGKPLLAFIAKEDHKAFHTQLSWLQLKGAGQERPWDVKLQPPGATPFPAALTVASMRGATGRVVSLRWIIRDITDRKQVEEELQKTRVELETRVKERTAELDKANQQLQNEIAERQRVEESLRRTAERLTVMREMDQAILAAESLGAIIQAALQRLQRLVPFDRASIVFFNHDAREANVMAIQENEGTEIGPGTRIPMHMFPMEDLRRGDIYPVEDLLTISEPSPLFKAILAEGVRSLIKVPLLVRGALIGTLNLGRLTPGPFAPEQRDIAREVADSLAVAIQQVRLREALRAYASTMEQLVDERTAELETFAYPVAHDLRAPLRAIQGFSDALLEEYGDRLDSVGQEYARRIIDSAQRLDNLIQALLAYARLSRVEIQLQPVDLAMAVAEAVAVVDTERLEREAQVTIEQPLPEVMAHRTILVQVITNLLTNAIKFVPPGVQPNVRLWAEPRDKYIRLWVEDNGIGIAPEHQDRIFQIFDRLHGNETYPGTGIGLAIVHKGVRRMGGRIGVESAPGQGSRFWVELVRP